MLKRERSERFYFLVNHESLSFKGEIFVHRELTYELRLKNMLQLPSNE